MTTPRKPRPPKINTPAGEGCGWEDHSVPAEIVAEFANLPPERRQPALVAIGEALGMFRALSAPSPVSPAAAREDVASVQRVAAELAERLGRFPDIGEAEADAVLHRWRRPLFAALRAGLVRDLRTLEDVCADVGERLGNIGKQGRPRADHRRQLAERLREIAKDAGLHRPASFTVRAFRALALDLPSPPKKSPPR